jgi:hypothetical protein
VTPAPPATAPVVIPSASAMPVTAPLAGIDSDPGPAVVTAPHTHATRGHATPDHATPDRVGRGRRAAAHTRDGAMHAVTRATAGVRVVFLPVVGPVQILTVGAGRVWPWPPVWAAALDGDGYLWCPVAHTTRARTVNADALALAARLEGGDGPWDRLVGDLLVVGVCPDGTVTDVPGPVMRAALGAGLVPADLVLACVGPQATATTALPTTAGEPLHVLTRRVRGRHLHPLLAGGPQVRVDPDLLLRVLAGLCRRP